MKFTIVYADAEEKFVKNVVLYGQASDNYVYADAGFTQKIDKATLLNLCMKGVLVLYAGSYYAPIAFKDNTTSVSLTIATNVAASGSASVVLNSEEYSAD